MGTGDLGRRCDGASPPQGGRLAGNAALPQASAPMPNSRHLQAHALAIDGGRFPLADLPACGGDVRQGRGGCLRPPQQ
ncbi:hypothetical protein SS05631_b63970 (plasmid) [Sinorhizobium sp. CCBAU 05631]|nr:hypothetical protein SS05631_b63970 [Sinorhizobium sp. CCBAU 05631]